VQAVARLDCNFIREKMCFLSLSLTVTSISDDSKSKMNLKIKAL